MGLFSSSQFFGIFLGGLVGGVLRTLNTPSITFMLITVLSCCWLLSIQYLGKLQADAPNIGRGVDSI